MMGRLSEDNESRVVLSRGSTALELLIYVHKTVFHLMNLAIRVDTEVLPHNL